MDDIQFINLMLGSVETLDRPTMGAVLTQMQVRDQPGFMVLKRGVQAMLREAKQIRSSKLIGCLGLPESANDRDIELAIAELKNVAQNNFGSAIEGVIDVASLPEGMVPEVAQNLHEANDLNRAFAAWMDSGDHRDYYTLIGMVGAVLDRYVPEWRSWRIDPPSHICALFARRSATANPKSIGHFLANLHILLTERQLAVAGVDFESAIRLLAIEWVGIINR